MPEQRPLHNWKEKDPLSASHLNEAWDMLRPLSNIHGGGGTKVTQFPNGTTVHSDEVQPFANPVRVRVNTTIASGRYNAKRYSSASPYVASGSFATTERGTIAAADDCIVIDPESAGLAD